ncbi:MAG: hypothetical protein ACLGXA_08965 [Acidobacteriota bacterium]
MSSRRVSILASVAVLGAALYVAVPGLRAEAAPLTTEELVALGANATFHTDLTFDESMLHAASQEMPGEDQPIIAKLRSISVHTYRYSSPGLYDPATLAAIRAQFDGEGWSHLVVKQPHPQVAAADPDAAPMQAEPPHDPMRTEVWVKMKHTNVEGIVLLVANEKNVNLIVIDGMISPLDLLHLRGHFGIPRFSGDEYEKGSR